MHIGIDARLVYYTRAGIGEYTLRLAQALAKAFPADQFTLLQDVRNRQPLIDAPNVRIEHSPVPSHHALEQLLLPWFVNRLQIDVFHSPDFIPPLRANGRQVVTIHDLAFLIYPHFLTKESARYYGQIDRAVRQAAQIIAVSNSSKRDLVRMLGTAEDKVSVIYEAADPLFRPVDRAAALHHVQALYEIPADFILFVSTIEPRKNVPGLLRAYRRLRDVYKLSPALVLVGAPGWLSEEVYQQVEELEPGRVLSLSRPCQHLRSAPALQRGPVPGSSGFLRRFRPHAAGGDGLRHASDCRQRVEHPRSSRGCRPVGRS